MMQCKEILNYIIIIVSPLLLNKLTMMTSLFISMSFIQIHEEEMVIH